MTARRRKKRNTVRVIAAALAWTVPVVVMAGLGGKAGADWAMKLAGGRDER